MSLPGLSIEAQAFLSDFVVDENPTDFTRIASVRAALISEQAPASERAIRRHRLHREDVRVAGIDCERITATKSGVGGGTLMYLFGGGFISGCPYSDLPIIGALAEQCSVEVIAPKYRLAPEYPAPAALHDCLAVWHRITESVTGALYLAGESAGGNLAVAVAQHAVDCRWRIPQAMALLSPAVDLRTDPVLLAPTAWSDPTIQPARLAEVAAVYVDDQSITDPSISPLFGEFRGLPPAIITTGTRDMLLAMCLRLHRQMKRAGVEVECNVWDGLWHVFEYYDQYPEAAESLSEIAAFLNRMGPP